MRGQTVVLKWRVYESRHRVLPAWLLTLPPHLPPHLPPGPVPDEGTVQSLTEEEEEAEEERSQAGEVSELEGCPVPYMGHLSAKQFGPNPLFCQPPSQA